MSVCVFFMLLFLFNSVVVTLYFWLFATILLVK
jgi:hypothetical protein